VEKPTVIVNYMKNMDRMDTADHYMATYSFIRRTLKWEVKLLFWGMEVSVIDIYILCGKLQEKQLHSNEPYQVQVRAGHGPCWEFLSGWWCIHKWITFYI
jgi:hypothetical protein